MVIIIINIYIYIYTHIFPPRLPAVPRTSAFPTRRSRTISQLRFSLLRFVDSNFPGKSPWAEEFHPFKASITLESNPPKSRILEQHRAQSRPSPYRSLSWGAFWTPCHKTRRTIMSLWFVLLCMIWVALLV